MTRVKSEELINRVQNEIVQLVEDEQRPAQNPRYTLSTQREGTARHHSRAGRSQFTDRNVGLVMNQQRSESCDRADQDSPDSAFRETRSIMCSFSTRPCPQDAKTVEVATGAVHPESEAEH